MLLHKIYAFHVKQLFDLILGHGNWNMFVPNCGQ